MPGKEIVLGADARSRLREGIDVVAETLKGTLGPRGRNVVVEKKFGSPEVVSDGVSIAREIDLEDHVMNMGAQLLKEASRKTNDDAGDGTTTSTVLAQAIIREGFKNVAAGADPMAIKRGLEFAMESIRASIKEQSTPVRNNEQIASVAVLSAHDEEIGALIADVMEKTGKNGVITVDESKSIHHETEFVEGLQIDRGFVSPYFVTNAERMEVILEGPEILITTRKISALADIMPVLESVAQAKKELLILADDVDGEALAVLVVNKIRGTLHSVAVKAPEFGDLRKALLEDIAILTGGTVISEELGRTMDSVKPEDLGRCTRVIVKRDTTTIIGGAGNPERIAARKKEIEAQIKEATSDYDKEKFQKRLAKLSGGVAVLKVGAATEMELKEKKLRVEDALEAARSAVEEGIVAGGGTVLIRAAQGLNDLKADSADEQTGIRILQAALSEPTRIIAANSGFEGGVILAEISRNSDRDFGFDAGSGKFGNMIEMGIVDPAKVTRCAVENAVSVAGMILTTEALIADLPEKAGASLPPPGAEMDY